jgi:hypothetical protein
MIHYRFCSNQRPLLTCDVCQEPIDEDEAVLMRAACALPEEPTFHVHPGCVDAFAQLHAGEWTVIGGHSQEAGWLM